MCLHTYVRLVPMATQVYLPNGHDWINGSMSCLGRQIDNDLAVLQNAPWVMNVGSENLCSGGTFGNSAFGVQTVIRFLYIRVVNKNSERTKNNHKKRMNDWKVIRLELREWKSGRLLVISEDTRRSPRAVHLNKKILVGRQRVFQAKEKRNK